MNDRGLERLLSETARGLRYPATPDLGAPVVVALPKPLPGRDFVLRPSLTVVVLSLALVLLAALTFGPSRDAIARLFGVEGSRIEILPTPLPGQTATPFPTANPRGTPDPRNVTPVDIGELPALTGFAAALPAVAEPRVQSSLVFYGGDAVAVHTYPSFELWQTQLEGQATFGKMASPSVRVREVEVGEWAGVWLSGAEHVVSYNDRNGQYIPASQRVVKRSTLIWRTDAFFYRIETDLSLEDAVRIAETLP